MFFILSDALTVTSDVGKIMDIFFCLRLFESRS